MTLQDPLPRPGTELVLVASFCPAAICAVLYYLQLYWVSIMQCLLAFCTFFFHYPWCICSLRSDPGVFDRAARYQSYAFCAMICD
jgi:hypothetical protein